MFKLTAEEEMIRDFVRRLAKKYDRRYWLAKAADGAFTQELWQELAAGGYLGMMVPAEYGGGGLGMRAMAVLQEEMGHQGIPLLLVVVSSVMSCLLISRYGTEAQKRRFLPPLARGEEKICFALTEPTAGSNSFATSTLARADGDFYVINGQKMFITGVDEADYIMLVARTTPFDQVADKRQGLSLFIVDRSSPGISMQAQDIRIPLPEKQFALFLDDVRVPRDHLLGQEGQGFHYLFNALNPERISGAAVSVGLGRYVLEKAVAYAKERVVFGSPIGAHQGLQHPLAQAKTDLEAAALMTRYAAWLFDNGGADAAAYANMAKLAAAEAAVEACDLAIEVHGGSGFTADMDVITVWPLVRVLRTVPVTREMILNYIGEHVLGLPRSY